MVDGSGILENGKQMSRSEYQITGTFRGVQISKYSRMNITKRSIGFFISQIDFFMDWGGIST